MSYCIIDYPSPNFDSRHDHAIDMLVLHYTGMTTAQDAIERLCNPTAEVSAHYLIDDNGAILRLVSETGRAWHAGVSYWRGHSNINQRSIGIEIVNPGHEFGYRDFHIAQMESLIILCQDILTRHAIPARNVVGHSDIAPARKEDPGERFDWKMLADADIGLWPQEALDIKDWGLVSPTIPNSQSLMPLQSYGYDTTDLPKTISAFQRHFRPHQLTGIWDEECAALLAALLIKAG